MPILKETIGIGGEPCLGEAIDPRYQNIGEPNYDIVKQ